MIERHQRCESGSTGYSYPEPAAAIGSGNSNSELLSGPPRSYLRQENKRVDTQNADSKPKKKVQFRNVATEPDLSEKFNETVRSVAEQQDSPRLTGGVSREDTMVEHSLAVNEEASDTKADDYLQALQSAKFDQWWCPIRSDLAADQ